jgi:hypothetical protein
MANILDYSLPTAPTKDPIGLMGAVFDSVSDNEMSEYMLNAMNSLYSKSKVKKTSISATISPEEPKKEKKEFAKMSSHTNRKTEYWFKKQIALIQKLDTVDAEKKNWIRKVYQWVKDDNVSPAQSYELMLALFVQFEYKN